MPNSKMTKRALIASMISLLLCVSMLIGGTFAWFTDTASTGINTIVSGNLDIALYKGEVTDGAIAYADEVTTSTKLFDDGAFWEPGHTEVAYLKVENLGDLALKYQLTVNVVNEVIGTSVLGNEIKLSKVLEYDLVEIAETDFYADRNAAMAAVQNAQNLETETVSGNMEPGDTCYLALIVYMPTDVGNEANYETGTTPPSIQLGVSVVATQYTAESDSYGDQYDVGATYPVVAIPVDEQLETETVGIPTEDVVIKNAAQTVTVTVPAENYTDGAETYNTTATVELTKSSSDSSEYQINVSITDSEGNDVELTEAVTVEIELVPGLTNVVVTHNGAGMTAVDDNNFTEDQQYSYNDATGLLTIFSKTFSPFEVSYDTNYSASINGVGYLTFRDAILGVKAGETIVLNKDVNAIAAEPYTVLVTKGSFAIDLNGKTMNYDGTGGSVSYENATFTIKNGTVKATGYGATGSLFVPKTGASFIMKDVTMEAKNCTVALAMGDAALVDIENCNATSLGSCGYFVGTNASSVDNYNVVINIKKTVADAFNAPVITNVPSTLNIEGCTLTGKTQTVIVRSGNATIKDTKLVNTLSSESTWSYFDNQAWGSGNSVAVSVLTVGDRASTPETKSAYIGDVIVDLTNVQFEYDETIESSKAVYIWGGQTDKNGTVKSASVTYDAACGLNTDSANGKVDIVIGSESGATATLK